MSDIETLKQDLAHTEDEIQILLDDLAERWPGVEVEVNCYRIATDTLGGHAGSVFNLKLSVEIKPKP